MKILACSTSIFGTIGRLVVKSALHYSSVYPSSVVWILVALNKTIKDTTSAREYSLIKSHSKNRLLFWSHEIFEVYIATIEVPMLLKRKKGKKKVWCWTVWKSFHEEGTQCDAVI